LATAADGELVLKLYEMRREDEMRKARRFMIFEFQPKTLEELRAVSRDLTVPENAAWRQVTSYWEMAHGLVLHGAIDADLFLDTTGEGVLVYAKYHHFHVETEKQSGNPFMRNTAALIAKFPAAQKLHQGFLKSLKLDKA
jgi:RNA 3'-terminal phosphate cyclase